MYWMLSVGGHGVTTRTFALLKSLQAGETVCGVARRQGMAPSLLFTRRRQVLRVGWAELRCRCRSRRDRAGGGSDHE